MEQTEPFQDLSKLIKEENRLQIDNHMIEIQKTIIHFGNKILQELKELKTTKEVQVQQNKSNKEPISSTIYDMDAPIRKYLQTVKIPKGYGGRS